MNNTIIIYIYKYKSSETIPFKINDNSSILKIAKYYLDLFNEDNKTNFKTDYLNHVKKIFVPRFHQQLFINKTLQLINNDATEVLIGAVPRSGKTFTTIYNIKENKNIIMV